MKVKQFFFSLLIILISVAAILFYSTKSLRMDNLSELMGQIATLNKEVDAISINRDPKKSMADMKKLTTEIQQTFNKIESQRDKISQKDMEEIQNQMQEIEKKLSQKSITNLEHIVAGSANQLDKKMLKELKHTIKGLKKTYSVAKPVLPPLSGPAQQSFNAANEYLKKAWLQDDKNLENKAIKEFKETIERGPTYVPAYMTLGLIYAYREKFNEAHEMVNKAEKINPNAKMDYDEYYQVKFFIENMKKSPLPIEYTSSEKNKTIRYRKKRYVWQKELTDEAYEELTRLLKEAHELSIDIGESVIEHFDKYNEKLSVSSIKGKVALLIEKYEKISSIYPDCEDAYLGLARAYRQINQYDKALKMYSKVMEINPNSIEAHQDIAFIYERKGLLPQARTEYKKVIFLDPESDLAEDARDKLKEPQFQ